MTEEQIKKEYLETDRTMKEAGKILGVEASTLCQFMKRHGIKAKPSNWKGVAWNSGKTYKDDARILAKEKHPRYIDGRTYASDFFALKKELLPAECYLCNKEGRMLHHMDGDKNNNSTENIKVLCPSCHTILHNERRGISEYTFKCGWCDREITIYNRKKNLPICCSLKCKAKYQYHISKKGAMYERNNRN